jgi:hypothetical protein
MEFPHHAEMEGGRSKSPARKRQPNCFFLAIYQD